MKIRKTRESHEGGKVKGKEREESRAGLQKVGLCISICTGLIYAFIKTGTRDECVDKCDCDTPGMHGE